MKKILILIFVFVSAANFAQSKWAAERQFLNFNYMKSAEMYKKLYDKGDNSYLVISRIGDSYYLNSQTEESEYWYRVLFGLINKENISAEYFFKYAQSLKSNGKYKESDDWLRKFRVKSAYDSRGRELQTNSNYLKEYTREKDSVIRLNNLSINTSYSDFGSFLSGNSLIFSSTRVNSNVDRKRMYKWNNQPYLDIYSGTEVKISGDNPDVVIYDVIDAKNVPSLNSEYHDATAVITKDGKTKYFTSNNFGKNLKKSKDKTVHLKLYRADKVGDSWDNITELPFNSNEYSTGHPALSTDEKTLYFISDMPSSIGQTDIYKVDIIGDGTYGVPINLGNSINTEGKEMFPFIASDNTLYFSSDGHLGLGLLDIFFSKNNYTSIENLGAPFNSPKDDFAYVLSDKGDHGFLSSNREGGMGDDDIYSFTLSQRKTICSKEIFGQVVDKNTGKLLPNSIVSLYDTKNNKITQLQVGQEAKFSFEVDCSSDYRLVGNKELYIESQRNIENIEEQDEINIKLELELEDAFISSGDRILINIKPIYFDLNKSYIRPDAALELDNLVAIMNQYPKYTVEVGSHTDARGSDIYNSNLSTSRAASTVAYVISKGISGNRISAKGYGETKPVNKCVDGVRCSEKEHQMNRRTEFVLTNYNTNSKIQSSNTIAVNSIKKDTKPIENDSKSEANMTEPIQKMLKPIIKQLDPIEKTSKSVVNKTQPIENNTYYVVKRGDTFFSISQKFGISVSKLKELNNSKDNIISIGQKLRVEKQKQKQTADSSIYTVVRGDTLYSISQRFGVKLDKLKQLNNLENNIISIGQKLKIR